MSLFLLLFVGACGETSKIVVSPVDLILTSPTNATPTDRIQSMM